MTDVNLFVFLCATRFFLIRARMLLRSQKKSRYVIITSMNPRRLATSKVSPRIRPPRIKKKIYKIRPAFSERSAYGRIM